jgi:hypothetical protein
MVSSAAWAREQAMAKPETEIVIRIGVAKLGGILLALLGLGTWLLVQFSGLNNKINDVRTDLTDRIQNARNDLSKNIDSVNQRVAKIEGTLKIFSQSGEKQIAELERKIALSQLESLVASAFQPTPTSMKQHTVVGTVDIIDLQKNTITIRDIQDKKIRFPIAQDTAANVYSTGRVETINIKDIKSGNPVAIGYETTPAGEKKVKFIGKSGWELTSTEARTKDKLHTGPEAWFERKALGKTPNPEIPASPSMGEPSSPKSDTPPESKGITKPDFSGSRSVSPNPLKK